MDREQYMNIAKETRFMILGYITKGIPYSRERKHIINDLFTIYWCKATEKVKYERIADRAMCIRIFKRQVKDAKYEYFTNTLKQHKKILSAIGHESMEGIADPATPYEALEYKQLVEAMVKKIKCYKNEKYLHLFWLRLVDEQPYKEIASLLCMREENVKKSVERLRKKLINAFPNIRK